MTYTLVVALLAVAALAYVAAPLRRNAEPERSTDPLAELEEAKRVALTAILDLENERDVGKLSEEDFAELRAVYEAQALAALHELDEVAEGKGADPVEREIARIRERLSTATCPRCGAKLPADGGPCTRCEN